MESKTQSKLKAHALSINKHNKDHERTDGELLSDRWTRLKKEAADKGLSPTESLLHVIFGGEDPKTDIMDGYAGTAHLFFKRVFDDEDGSGLANGSRLEHFLGHGVGFEYDGNERDFQEMGIQWFAWVKNKVQEVYGIEIQSPDMLFIDLFWQIEQLSQQPS